MELSIYDANALAKYEAIIERGMAEFVAVGEALLSIRNQRLYRATHNSFEAYCADKWGMSRRRADQLIGASQTVLLLTDSVDEEPRTNSSQFPSDEVGNNVSHFLPKNERQALALTVLEPAQQIEAWTEAVATAPNGKVTAAHVQSVVDDIRGNGHKPHVAHNSGENEWYTPAWIIEAARTAMGSIDCDPASSSTANQTVKAETFFTAEDDGLGNRWDGNVWLNPPYSKELIGRFVEGVIERYHAGEVRQACVLVNNATETIWGQALIEASAAVCFLNSRVKFLRPDGSTGAPLQGQMVCFLTSQYVNAFTDAFSEYGKVMCHAAR